MIQPNRLSKKEIQKSRQHFWICWTFLVTMPASLAAYLLDGSWWASPVIVMVSTVVGYNTFEWWLRNRQTRADNTIVLCYCGHGVDTHGLSTDMDRSCYHGENVTDYARGCLCLDYTPRFWRMF